MRRFFTYAVAGALLSAGAPLGLLAVRFAQQREVRGRSLRQAIDEVTEDPVSFLYVAASTAVVFTAFGCVLGRQADRLARLSETDALTGLVNARGFFERLGKEIGRAKRYRQPLALLLVDLDGLKQINDVHGHHAGDRAIRALADVIRAELRASDVGARWGGDEFAVLAPNTQADAALALAERIRALITTQPVEPPLSGSVGVSVLDPASGDEAVDSATLMRGADAALYEAKRRGRNTVVMAPLRDAAAREG